MRARLGSAATLLALFAGGEAAIATPVACGPGFVDIQASRTDPGAGEVSFAAGDTANVGERVTLIAAATANLPPARFSWVVEGPLIRDYYELVGVAPVAMAPDPIAFQTLPLRPADFTRRTVSFYSKPGPDQIFPQNAGPEDRTVELRVTLQGGTVCIVSAVFFVERNGSDPERQAEDFYTSNHLAPGETNVLKGAVVDEHMLWHHREGLGGMGQQDFIYWMRFLRWHHEFLNRFDLWRAEFGYGPVETWDPGTDLLTGIEYDHPADLRNPTYDRVLGSVPTWLGVTGGPETDPRLTNPFRRLSDHPDLETLSLLFESGFHGLPHCLIGVVADDFFAGDGAGFGSMCAASSPKDPMFWRWHRYVDVVFRNYCRPDPTRCSGYAGALADADLEVSDDGGTPGGAPEIWNLRSPATCSPSWPRDGVERSCGQLVHEDPVAGQDNFLYVKVHSGAQSAGRVEYAELGVWAGASDLALVNLLDAGIPPNALGPRSAGHAAALGLAPGGGTILGPVIWRPSQLGQQTILVQVSSIQDLGPLAGADAITQAAAENAALISNNVAMKEVTVIGMVAGAQDVPAPPSAATCSPLSTASIVATTEAGWLVVSEGPDVIWATEVRQSGGTVDQMLAAFSEVCAADSPAGAPGGTLRWLQ